MIYKIDSIQNRNCNGFMAKPAENYLFVSVKHLPNDKFWTGTNIDKSTGKTEINYQNIITISKQPQMKEIYYSVDFKDFYTSASGRKTFMKFRKNEIVVNGREISDFYEIDHGYPERVTKPTSIELIYWTNNEGLVAYKNKMGVWWTKKNL